MTRMKEHRTAANLLKLPRRRSPARPQTLRGDENATSEGMHVSLPALGPTTKATLLMLRGRMRK